MENHFPGRSTLQAVETLPGHDFRKDRRVSTLVALSAPLRETLAGLCGRKKAVHFKSKITNTG